jgi:hypothetical protein
VPPPPVSGAAVGNAVLTGAEVCAVGAGVEPACVCAGVTEPDACGELEAWDDAEVWDDAGAAADTEVWDDAET